MSLSLLHIVDPQSFSMSSVDFAYATGGNGCHRFSLLRTWIVNEIVTSDYWRSDQDFGDLETVSCGLQIFVRRGDIDSSNGKRENIPGSIAKRR
jgi:hypothetical protein